MGRRALRKIDPNCDLSRWLLEEEDLPGRLPADSLFGRTAPWEIEIGSGKGLFLTRATEVFPGHDFLGIEIAHKYARFAAAGLATRDRTNGKLIHGDGVRILSQRVHNDSLAAVHVYFPDPWWKKRHRKRRVMQEGFVVTVQRVLRAGGVLHFWTDVREYYEATWALIDRATDLRGVETPSEEEAHHEFDYRTHFERRMRLNDLPVYRAQFRKP